MPSFSGFVPLKKGKIKGEKREKKMGNKFLKGKKKYKKKNKWGVGGRGTKFNNSDNNNALMY